MRAFTFAGLRAAVDPLTGIGGLVLPDPSKDAVDPFPADSLTMNEATITRAIREMGRLDITPSLNADDEWTYLDQDGWILSLECPAVHEHVTLEEISESIQSILSHLEAD